MSNGNGTNYGTIAGVQRQTDEVMDVMRDNISKVLTRDENLAQLEEDAESLRQSARIFQAKSTRLKRQMWYTDKKMLLVLISVFIVLLLLIILPLTVKS